MNRGSLQRRRNFQSAFHRGTHCYARLMGFGLVFGLTFSPLFIAALTATLSVGDVITSLAFSPLFIAALTATIFLR